jgi:hypothetical protein
VEGSVAGCRRRGERVGGGERVRKRERETRKKKRPTVTNKERAGKREGVKT